MRLFGSLFVFACIILSSANIYAQDILEKQERALKVIDEFATKLCTSDAIQTKGGIQKIELTGTAKTELKGIIKKVADLGIKGAAKYQTTKYEGLLQQDLANTLNKRINCKLEVFISLKDRLIPMYTPKRTEGKNESETRKTRVITRKTNEYKTDKIKLIGTWKGTLSKGGELLDIKKLEYRIRKKPDDYGKISILVKGWYGDDDFYEVDWAQYGEELINGERIGFLKWDDNFGITEITISKDIMTGTIKPYAFDNRTRLLVGLETETLVKLNLKKVY